MALRPCLTCGRLSPGTRCPQHAHTYGRAHDTDRARWAPLVATGTVVCPRCHQPIHKDQPWQHDHINGGLHPAHRLCNEGNVNPDAR